MYLIILFQIIWWLYFPDEYAIQNQYIIFLIEIIW